MPDSSAAGLLNFPPFRLYHAAYVASDLDKGLQRLRETHGFDEFEIYRDIEIQVPAGIAKIDVGLAKTGVMPIEIIVPRGGEDGVYRSALSPDHNAIVFHHFCSRVETADEWRRVLQNIDDNNLRILALGSGYGAAGYVYVDTRPMLGHILEFLYRASDQ